MKPTDLLFALFLICAGLFLVGKAIFNAMQEEMGGVLLAIDKMVFYLFIYFGTFVAFFGVFGILQFCFADRSWVISGLKAAAICIAAAGLFIAVLVPVLIIIMIGYLAITYFKDRHSCDKDQIIYDLQQNLEKRGRKKE